ncbi:MAG TPA: TlpA disulfide reductase family protein, partial [Pyrinomonadaceae bacterium]|nr:TlpA disulfide reductase family protein [Pyrinomonadaceae bacterium]
TIDKKTLLPVEVLLTNDKNKDFTKTTFSDMTESPASPSALSWYYSTYSGEYKPEKPAEHKLIKAGQTPPDFKLNRFDSAAQTSLEQYKGKVVLVEFWIAHCGFCIAAVPKLNGIAEAFRAKGLEVISINIHDPAATIGLFKRNNKPEFTILTEGAPTATEYGVNAYPGIVLIGKDGKVAYSSLGLFEKELEAAITANLQ